MSDAGSAALRRIIRSCAGVAGNSESTTVSVQAKWRRKSTTPVTANRRGQLIASSASPPQAVRLVGAGCDHNHPDASVPGGTPAPAPSPESRTEIRDRPRDSDELTPGESRTTSPQSGCESRASSVSESLSLTAPFFRRNCKYKGVAWRKTQWWFQYLGVSDADAGRVLCAGGLIGRWGAIRLGFRMGKYE